MERGRVLKVEDYIPAKLFPRGWEQQQTLRNTASGLPASVLRAGQKDERPWHAISASWNDLPAHCIERFTKHLLLYASQTLSQIGFALTSGFVTHYERIPETSVVKEWLLIEAPNGALARAFFYMFEGYVLETEDEGVSYMLNLYHCRFRSEIMSPMRRAKVLYLQRECVENLTVQSFRDAFPQLPQFLWEQALPADARTAGLPAVADEDVAAELSRASQ